jgi:hypothetical protein
MQKLSLRQLDSLGQRKTEDFKYLSKIMPTRKSWWCWATKKRLENQQSQRGKRQGLDKGNSDLCQQTWSLIPLAMLANWGVFAFLNI